MVATVGCMASCRVVALVCVQMRIEELRRQLAILTPRLVSLEGRKETIAIELTNHMQQMQGRLAALETLGDQTYAPPTGMWRS